VTPVCDIIIPIWNQPALTQRCLESVATATTTPYRLILIDNGSEVPTRELLAATARHDSNRVTVIRNEENLGFIKAVNQGVRASSAPAVCLLNNDTVVTPGWLETMLRVAEQDPAIGLVNPSSNTLGYRPPSATVEAIGAYAQQVVAPLGQQTRELATAIGFCLLITRAVLDTIGLFDERYGMGNFEDADFSKRAVHAGYRCVQALGAYVYHEEKASFKLRPGWEDGFRVNRELFEQRWGRPLRILWEAHDSDPTMAAAWTPIFLRLAREGHWLWYSAPDGLVPAAVRRYTNVQALEETNRWRLENLWFVLKRRKKPIDLVVAQDETLARWLALARPGHRAVLLRRPAPTEVEYQCQRLSRSQ